MYKIIFLINKIEYILEILIFIRIILSWIPNFNNSFTEIVYSLTDPLLKNFSKVLRIGNLYVDIAPFIFIIILRLIRYLIISVILFLL